MCNAVYGGPCVVCVVLLLYVETRMLHRAARRSEGSASRAESGGLHGLRLQGAVLAAPAPAPHRLLARWARSAPPPLLLPLRVCAAARRLDSCWRGSHACMLLRLFVFLFTCCSGSSRGASPCAADARDQFRVFQALEHYLAEPRLMREHCLFPLSPDVQTQLITG